jgi:hypothetical protein
MVVNLTAEPIRATALGTLTLANNLLGLPAGPFVVGPRTVRSRWTVASAPSTVEPRCAQDPGDRCSASCHVLAGSLAFPPAIPIVLPG